MKRRRTLRTTLLVVAAFVAVLAAGSIAQAFGAKRLLERAQPLVAAARSAAERVDLAAAEASLRQALALVRRAEATADGAWLRGAGAIPWAGRSARALESITDAAEAAVRSALQAAAAGRAFPSVGGRPAIGFRDGRIDVFAWTAARTPLQSARSLAEDAAAHVRRAPRTMILPPVARALDRMVRETARLRRATEDATSLAALVPELAGGPGTRRYLLVFQNPAEARGTGGLLGGVGLIEAAGGRMDLVRTRPDDQLVPLSQPALEMPPWYTARYDRHRARTLWSNVTMEPDFPTSAPLIAAYYERTFAERVDGVIAIDPFALEQILSVTGPVRGPSGVQFEAASVARFVMSDSYAQFPDPTRRKAVVLEAAHVVFDRLKAGVEAQELAPALARAAREKHVMVWMRASAAQRAAEALGVAGRFGDPGRTSIGVVTQNAAENKIDYYLRRTIRLDVHLRSDGVADGTLRVRLENLAPSSGLPRDVIGPITKPEGRGRDPSRYVAGLNIAWLSAYLPPGAQVLSWRVGGARAGSDQAIAPHATITSLFVEIGSRQSVEATLAFRLPAEPGRGWSDRRLALLVPRQPAAAPDQVEVVVEVPDGYRIYPGGQRRFELRTVTNEDIPVGLRVRRPLWARLADAR